MSDVVHNSCCSNKGTEQISYANLSNLQLEALLDKYKWYHNIQLNDVVITPGVKEFAKLASPVINQISSLEIVGKRVLDIGCRDGLFCFEAEKLGALSVLGIDTSLSIGATEMLIPYLKSKVEMREMSLYELSIETHGVFDIVIFSGVLYHLRYPFSALSILSELVAENGYMIIETGIFADDDTRALLFCPTGDESPYEKSSVTFYNRKGMMDSLRSFGLVTERVDYQDENDRYCDDGRIVRGTFLCKKNNEVKNEYPHHYWNGGIHNNWKKLAV